MQHRRSLVVARLAAVLLGIVALAAAAAPAAAARPPVNDQLRKATVIAALPFAETSDTGGAKAAPSDPTSSCVANQGATVFYQFMPGETGWYVADTTGSSYDTVLTVYAVTDAGLVEVACVDDDEGGNLQTYLRFAAEGGSRYIVMVGAFANPGAVGRGGALAFTLGAGS